MKPHLGGWLKKMRISAKAPGTQTIHPVLFSLAACCLLLTALGCESFQRKFTRKPKQAAKPPSPIVQFHDYSGAMTPLERYRKHYNIFDYWNDDLLRALDAKSPNPKRYRRASEESLLELRTLRSLLADELAFQLDPLITQREAMDKQLRANSLGVSPNSPITRTLEAHSRKIHREFFWRNIQEQLKPKSE